jgi:hypothetical protein
MPAHGRTLQVRQLWRSALNKYSMMLCRSASKLEIGEPDAVQNGRGIIADFRELTEAAAAPSLVQVDIDAVLAFRHRSNRR